MSKRNHTLIVLGARMFLPIASVLALAGCEAASGITDDVYVPTSHYERFPIEVAQKPVKLDVSAAQARLGPQQSDTVARFAQSAVSNRVSSIHIRRPSGGGKSNAVAESIAAVLLRNGISRDAIVQTTYEGRAGSPVLVSYVRNVAITKRCGDWTSDMVDSGDNEPYSNFGCTSQNNLAALVSDPGDLVAPRAMSPSDPARRSTVFDKYRKGETTVTSVDQQQQQISIAAVAQ